MVITYKNIGTLLEKLCHSFHAGMHTGFHEKSVMIQHCNSLLEFRFVWTVPGYFYSSSVHAASYFSCKYGQ